MKGLLQNLQSGEWWVGIVIVSILLNVLSSYLKGYIDSLFGRVSHRWKMRTAAQSNARNKRIDEMRDNSELRVIRAFASIHQALWGMFIGSFGVFPMIWMLFSVGLFRYLLAVLGAVFFTVAMSTLANANERFCECLESRKVKVVDQNPLLESVRS
jgi:hypothetical protein